MGKRQVGGGEENLGLRAKKLNVVPVKLDQMVNERRRGGRHFWTPGPHGNLISSAGPLPEPRIAEVPVYSMFSSPAPGFASRVNTRILIVSPVVDC